MMGRKKIEIIQAMRGIAALGIVYFHTEYGPWRSANWGVDFFFILSGYFLMMSTKAVVGGGQYWKSKLRRICPLYYFMTIVVAIGCLLVPSVFRSTIVNAETLIKSFLFLPCYAGNGKIFPVYSIGWTLNLEMFFYLLFFIALKINHKQRGNIVIGMACLLIVLGIVFRPENVMLKFWTQPRLFDFVIGIGIYCLEQRMGRPKVDRKICITGIGASILLLFSGYYLLGDCFGYLWNMLWGGILLFLCLPLYDMPVNRFMKLLGDMSYSIYMAHFLIIGFICRVLIDNTKLSLTNTVFVMAAVAFVIPCSWVVYQVFEVRKNHICH